MLFRFREVRMTDAGAVARVEAVSMKVHAEGAPDQFRLLPEVNGDQKIAFWSDNGMRAWVAETPAHDVVGFVCVDVRLCGMNDADSRKTEKVWYISEIAVDEGYQDKGIGTALLDFVAAEATREKADSLELTVALFNVKAKALYEKLGFSVANFKMKKPLK